MKSCQLKLFMKLAYFSKSMFGGFFFWGGEGGRRVRTGTRPVWTLSLWNYLKANVITLSEKWGFGLLLIWSCKKSFGFLNKCKVKDSKYCQSPPPQLFIVTLFPAWAWQNNCKAWTQLSFVSFKESSNWYQMILHIMVSKHKLFVLFCL